MAKNTQIIVRSASDFDRPQLANLVHFEAHVHRHLDWRPPLDWIGSSPYLVAERGNQLLAALACPPDPEDVAWIRLFAVSSYWPVNEAWITMWTEAEAQLSKEAGLKVAAIPLQQWFQALLESSQFVHVYNIVLLLWQRGQHTLPEIQIPVVIRPMNLDDMPAVEAVDRAAFGDLWRNSMLSLELAFRQSAVATVAEDENGILGYQISTASPMGGHLARLAVHPSTQRRGIGLALVRDMLDQFERRGALHVTVNTQEDNGSSLSLYKRAGFHRTGESYPVYQYMPEKK